VDLFYCGDHSQKRISFQPALTMDKAAIESRS
jgi:hypothetical protein